MNRQRAFLCNPEWIDFPWKTDVEVAQHPLHSMLDIALKVLPQIEKQDMPRKWKLACLKARLNKIRAIVHELEDWEDRLRSRHDGRIYNEVPSTWGGAYRHRFAFPDFRTAVAFAMYTAVRIHVASLLASVSEEILSREPTAEVHPSSHTLDALRWSRLACQSLEYFDTGLPKVAGRIVTLWPLETAWELFCRLQREASVEISQEIAWCRSVAAKYATLGIPPFQWR